ncbi:MAG: efflux RND transporter periplasmic adaptor subunit [Deltaproteobacteria bacterium]|nr:efflux RND transporter periplasmic adaptor subunit [Deltaproteobacteria bacterium]
MNSQKVEKVSKPAMIVIKSVGASLLILMIGIVGMTLLTSLKKPPAEAQIEERLLRVKAQVVRSEDVPVFITGYGETRALNVVSISPEVSGRIVAIHPRLEIGETVTAGEILFQIDPRDYHAAHLEALATEEQIKNSIIRLKKQSDIDQRRLKTLQRNRELAAAEYERFHKLFEENNVVSKSRVDSAEQAMNSVTDQVDQMAQTVALYPIRIRETDASLAAAQARRNLTATRLKRCDVRAPFNGRIKSVSLEKDQYVTPGQLVITLADDSILEIHVSLDSRDARQWLQFNGTDTGRNSAWFNGLKPVICNIRWTEENNGQTWKSRLHRVVRFDPQTRTLTVAVRMDAGDNAGGNQDTMPLVEGMFCSVQIPGRILHDVFRLPRQAVSFENTVYTAVENRLKTVAVDVARLEGDYAFIAGGLKSGDVVVTTRLIDPLENVLLEIKK